MSEIFQIPVLITEEYLKEYSPIPNNFDWSEVKAFIPIAEEIHIIPIIGRMLYNELIEQVQNNKVTDVNSSLLLKIYQLEAIAVAYETLPFIWAHITEKGITLGKSDNSDSIELEDLSEITNHLNAQLAVFKKMLREFLERNADCFPLFEVENDCCKPHNVGDIRLYSSSIERKPRNL